MVDLDILQLVRDYERDDIIGEYNGFAFQHYLKHGSIDPEMEYFWMYDYDFLKRKQSIEFVKYRDDDLGYIYLELSKDDLVLMRLAYKGSEDFYDIFNRQDKKGLELHITNFLKKKGIKVPI